MKDTVVGTIMPVLNMELQPGESIISESGELSWLTSSIGIETATGFGASKAGVMGVLKRAVSGGSIFMSKYTAQGGVGVVSFATKLPGAIFPIDISPQPGGIWLGHRHAFVCGTDSVELTFGFQQRLGAGFFGGNGFILQKMAGQGRAWVELSGEVITVDLQPGENIRVHPGHVGLFQDTVNFDITTVPGIKNKIFGGDGLFLASLTGPGRVYLQSLTIGGLAAKIAEYLPSSGGDGGNSVAGGGILGAFLGGDSS